MQRAKPRWDDQRIETIIGNLLRAGVVLAASAMRIVYLHGSSLPRNSLNAESRWRSQSSIKETSRV
jgi:hypothetical protein